MTSTTELADALIACQDQAGTLAPITGGDPTFDVPRAYEVLAEINARREAQGWIPVGRKIGFTNRTIWERYGVYQPMWAPVWSHSVHFAQHGAETLPLAGFVQPRSGLALRHGVTCLNTPGLIDAGYRDEISVLLVNLDPDAVVIGMPVRVTFEHHPDPDGDVWIPLFEPDAEERA